MCGSRRISLIQQLLIPPIRCVQAIEKMVVDVDKGHLRAMQKESYLAMARCCDTAAGPAELQQW